MMAFIQQRRQKKLSLHTPRCTRICSVLAARGRAYVHQSARSILKGACRNTEPLHVTGSHTVVGHIELPEARKVRQPFQTSRRGPQLVTGEVELGQARQMFQIFDPPYLWAPIERGGGAVSSYLTCLRETASTFARAVSNIFPRWQRRQVENQTKPTNTTIYLFLTSFRSRPHQESQKRDNRALGVRAHDTATKQVAQATTRVISMQQAVITIIPEMSYYISIFL